MPLTKIGKIIVAEIEDSLEENIRKFKAHYQVSEKRLTTYPRPDLCRSFSIVIAYL